MPGALPVPAAIPSFPPTLPPTEPLTNSDNTSDSQNTLKEVKDILLQLLDASSELGPKSNDIKRRLAVMEDMWLSGKLNNRIQQLMKELANGN